MAEAAGVQAADGHDAQFVSEGKQRSCFKPDYNRSDSRVFIILLGGSNTLNKDPFK